MRHLSKLVAKWTVTKKEINSCQIKWQQQKKSPNKKLNCFPMKCIAVTCCPTIQLQIESHWRMRFERYFWCGYNWKAGEMHQKMNYAFNQNLFWANCVSLENFSHNTPSWNVWLPMKAGLAKALKSSIFLSGSVIVSHLRRRELQNSFATWVTESHHVRHTCWAAWWCGKREWDIDVLLYNIFWLFAEIKRLGRCKNIIFILITIFKHLNLLWLSSSWVMDNMETFWKCPVRQDRVIMMLRLGGIPSVWVESFHLFRRYPYLRSIFTRS